MIEKMKKIVDLRLAATIALGVFVALFAYRVLAAAIAWWSLGWSQITDPQQTTLSLVISATLCAATFFLARTLVRRARQAMALRTANRAEADRQRQIRSNMQAFNRQTQLCQFLQWLRSPQAAEIFYITPDAVMEDPDSQRVLESMRRLSTEELLNIALSNDTGKWTSVGRGIARQVLLHRAKSPDFSDAVERFKKDYVPHTAA